MRETSAVYKGIRGSGNFAYTVNVVCNDTSTTYGMDKLKSIRIKPMLFMLNGPSIGNAASTECDIVLVEDSLNWPRMAQFEVKIQIHSTVTEQYSEWISMGTFYTDERSKTESGDLSIVGFDQMLTTECYWTDEITPPSQWPITAKAWCDLIEDAGLAEFDERNNINNTIAFVGLDTTSTVRDKLKDIAAAHGGNFVMTADNKLRLVPLTNTIVTDDSAIAGIAIAGVAIVGKTGGGSSSGDYQDIGYAMRTFSQSTALDAITGVELKTMFGVSVTAGTDTGYVLKGTCNFSDTDNLADLCLSKVSGYVYRGFNATQAYLDPVCEPGDIILYNNVAYQIMYISWNINHMPTADIMAPYEEEIDHEYTYEDEQAKTIRIVEEETNEKLHNYPTLEEASSLIQQSASQILFDVSETYYSKTDVDEIQATNISNFTLTSQQIQAALTQISELNGDVEEINYYIRYKVISGVGTVVVGQTNSLAELHITNTQISLMYNGDVISYWNQNKQYTPKQLEIPNGGSLRIGNLLVQPRSSGNVSVMWLGES